MLKEENRFSIKKIEIVTALSPDELCSKVNKMLSQPVDTYYRWKVLGPAQYEGGFWFITLSL